MRTRARSEDAGDVPSISFCSSRWRAHQRGDSLYKSATARTRSRTRAAWRKGDPSALTTALYWDGGGAVLEP
jgi:hypothetical protein